MNAPDKFEQLLRLASRGCESELQPEEAAELEALLLDDPAAQRAWVLLLEQDLQLTWLTSSGVVAEPEDEHASRERADEVALPALSEVEGSEVKGFTSPLVPASDRPTVPSQHTPVLGFLASVSRRVPGGEFTVGSLLLLVIVAAFWGLSQAILYPRSGGHDLAHDLSPLAPDKGREARGEGAAVATITASEATKWNGPSATGLTDASTRGQTVTANQPLSIQSGLVELELQSGTTLVIQGPAEWTIDGDNQARLEVGRLVARVPKQAIGFRLVTPTAEIVDLGTEFATSVTPVGQTEVHVLKGIVETTPRAEVSGKTKSIRLVAGNAVRVPVAGGVLQSIPVDLDEFISAREALDRKSAPLARFTGAIPLGNLFDDREPVSLAEAVATDKFQAVPDRDHLGIERVFTGGDAVREIAPAIRVDLASSGWSGAAYSLPVNDAVCVGNSEPIYSLRTQGSQLAAGQAKAEDGIGMHANSLITFNIDEIRKAGGLEGAPLRFVSDRVGINDTAFGIERASINCLAVVSGADRVLAAFRDGAQAEVTFKNGVYQIVGEQGTPSKADGRFARYEIPLPPAAKYLTLVVSSADDIIHNDHGVWSGARLELEQEANH